MTRSIILFSVNIHIISINKYVINVKLTGEKKQVSIVESAEQEDCAKKRREKLQRQDTPLHPHSVR